MFLPDPAPCGQSTCDSPRPVVPTPRHHLDPAERTIVLLARADSRRFGWDAAPPRSHAAAALRRLFVGLTGIATVAPLADPRLERLRLFACMMRNGDARADAMAERLMLDGYGESALREAVGLALG